MTTRTTRHNETGSSPLIIRFALKRLLTIPQGRQNADEYRRDQEYRRKDGRQHQRILDAHSHHDRPGGGSSRLEKDASEQSDVVTELLPFREHEDDHRSGTENRAQDECRRQADEKSLKALHNTPFSEYR